MNVSEIVEIISTIPGIDLVVKAFGIAAIVLAIYLGFLLIRGIWYMKALIRISKMDKNIKKIVDILERMEAKQ